MLFWKWEKAIPKEVCEALIQEMKNEQLHDSEVGTIDMHIIDKRIRNSQQQWLKPNHWFEGILWNHIRYANQSLGLNYDITHPENVQYTVYKKGEKYDWHHDQKIGEPTHPDMRKLSAVCQLSDKNDFTGGGLVAKSDDTEESPSLLLEQGDIVVMPSYTYHKALSVKSGERIVTVMWARGPAFK